jgi:hypothetical protein
MQALATDDDCPDRSFVARHVCHSPMGACRVRGWRTAFGYERPRDRATRSSAPSGRAAGEIRHKSASPHPRARKGCLRASEPRGVDAGSAEQQFGAQKSRPRSENLIRLANGTMSSVDLASKPCAAHQADRRSFDRDVGRGAGGGGGVGADAQRLQRLTLRLRRSRRPRVRSRESPGRCDVSGRPRSAVDWSVARLVPRPVRGATCHLRGPSGLLIVMRQWRRGSPTLGCSCPSAHQQHLWSCRRDCRRSSRRGRGPWHPRCRDR